jgi:hypothetical protein
MMTRSSAVSRLARAILGGALALVAAFPASAWGQPPPAATGRPAAGAATPTPGSTRAEQEAGRQADQARVGLDVMAAWLEAKRALLRIDESRAEQAKLWKTYYEKMARDGKVTEDRAVAARDDVLMLEEHVGAERAELKAAELRLKNAARRASPGDESAGADQARGDGEVLEAMAEAKRSLLRAGESRLEQARRAQARYDGLFRRGMATEDQVLAAQDDVLMMEAALAWGRAELKVSELRARDERLAARGGAEADGTGRRLSELEDRLIGAEMRADMLQHEVGRLRRELPRETHGAR